MVAGHPALHSICLSNEPAFTEGTKSRFVREMWRRWLAREHGTIQALNARWGTQYASFDAVPVPPADFQPTPIVYDFIRFNQEAFAEFHAWMARIIREVAPGVPVHAKIMIHAALMRHAPRTREHDFGLLSCTLVGCLEPAHRPMSYRELGRSIVARYRAERGSRGPAPSFHGDLDREVLGARTRRPAPIALGRQDGRLVVSAGELSGLSQGAVLAVYPPPGDRRDPKTLLGHVKVSGLGPLSAEVRASGFGGKKAVAPGDLPALARCEVVDCGDDDLRIKPIPVRITGNPTGAEGIVVFAVSMAACAQEPDFGLLAQGPLHAADSLTRGSGLLEILPIAVAQVRQGGHLLLDSAPCPTAENR